MMDSGSIPPRLGHMYGPNKDPVRMQAAADHAAKLMPDKLGRDALSATLRQTSRPYAVPVDIAASDATTQPYTSSSRHFSRPSFSDNHSVVALDAQRPSIAPVSSPQTQQFSAQRQHASANDSQESNLTNESDLVFTPPASEGEMSGGNLNGHSSSQESQLLQLSQIAAAQDKMMDLDSPAATSRKRMADGMVKSAADRASTSPVRSGHSRNTSTVSMASTTGSRIGELSADLKTRLSYAMVKVNHGWHSHSIDEVESLASQAVSPTSSNSTLHGRHASSASPRLHVPSNHTTTGASTGSSNPSPATYETFWRDGSHARAGRTSVSPPSSSQYAPTLAPPAPIQPSRSTTQHNARRNSNPRYTPTLLSQSHSASPQTPAQSNSLHTTPSQRLNRTPMLDPILFSPHQNVREQDAIETLIFMSSPGNSANLKHTYSPSTSSQHATDRAGGRHNLPTSQPRKSLPSHRPLPQKRVGFEKSPGGMTTLGDMDVDMGSPQLGMPQSRAVPRRRVNGSGSGYPAAVSGNMGLRGQLVLPAALGGGSFRPRPSLGDEDIERMLDRVAHADADSSDDEGEIQLPARGRREGASVAGL